MINKALKFAIEAHLGQFRKGTNIPYIMHPIEAATIVASMKFDEELITAAMLHDVAEDTKYTIMDIKTQFGERIAHLVDSESEDKTKTWEERKQHTIEHLSAETDQDILIIALGDKLSNIRAIYSDYHTIGDKLWDRFNMGREYQGWYYKSLVNSFMQLKEFDSYKEFKKKDR